MLSLTCYKLLVPTIAVALIGSLSASAIQAQSADARVSSPVQSDMKVYVDPETGRITSTPVTEEQKRAAANAMPVPDYSKIITIEKADGSTEFQFNGQVQDALVATRNADGKLEMTCSEHGDVHQHEAAAMAAKSVGGRDVK